jgi:DNA repair protein RadC
MPHGIKEWPEDERPREKLLKFGVEKLSEAELLAIILRTGDSTSHQSALDLGRALLIRFTSFRGLVQASVAEICEVSGIGPAKAASLKAAFHLATKLSQETLRIGSDRYTDPAQIFEYYRYRYREQRMEYFLAMLLDGKNRIIKEVQISQGSLNQSIVHPREVFSPAVRDSAAAVILVHNHPTGDPTPSREDLAITRRLREAGEIMGIKVLDHIIIGDDQFTSFVSQGLM